VVPPLNPDGVYVVLYASHTGDTRGNEWYTHITALSYDPTAIPPRAINVLTPPGVASPQG
jgi:hypothetical protein